MALISPIPTVQCTVGAKSQDQKITWWTIAVLSLPFQCYQMKGIIWTWFLFTIFLLDASLAQCRVFSTGLWYDMMDPKSHWYLYQWGDPPAPLLSPHSLERNVRLGPKLWNNAKKARRNYHSQPSVLGMDYSNKTKAVDLKIFSESWNFI